MYERLYIGMLTGHSYSVSDSPKCLKCLAKMTDDRIFNVWNDWFFSSRLWDLGPFHLLLPDVHLLKCLQRAHVPVVNAEGTFSGATSATLWSSPPCRAPAFFPASHSPLMAWPILLWAPWNSASCTHGGGMPCTGHHSCVGTPCIPGDIAQGHFLLACPPVALSVGSASSLQCSQIPAPICHCTCFLIVCGPPRGGEYLHLCICGP